MFKLMKTNESNRRTVVATNPDAQTLRDMADNLRSELPEGSSTFYTVEKR